MAEFNRYRLEEGDIVICSCCKKFVNQERAGFVKNPHGHDFFTYYVCSDETKQVPLCCNCNNYLQHESTAEEVLEKYNRITADDVEELIKANL